MKAVAATRVEKGRAADPIKPHNALTMLAAEHKTLLAMFRDYERGRGAATRHAKGKLALRICHLLSLHLGLEEEIFYPAVERVLGKKAQGMMSEARVEHASMRSLIETLENESARDPTFDATVRVLGAQVRQHFTEEEEEVFPLVRRSKLDLAGVGERLASRELEISTRRPGKNTFREGRKVLAN